MKVLFVSPSVPWPLDSGGRIRTYKLLEAAGAHAEVHLRAVASAELDRAAADTLRRICSSVAFFPRSVPGPIRRWTAPKLERWFHSAGLRAALEEELGSRRCDLVHLDEMFLARVLPHPCVAPVVVHHHKLDTELQEQLPLAPGLAGSFDLWKLRRLEREAARRHVHHVLCSEEDARSLRLRYPRLDCAVVENGFDPDFFRPPDPPRERDPDRLLFLGSMSYGPNVDAVLHFVRDVLPLVRRRRPQTVLEVAGSAPSAQIRDLASREVRVLGPLADVRPALERCGALVAPLRIGGGSRIKLVEALGHATPAVTTSIGKQGLRFEDRVHLRIADGPQDFADAAVELLEHPAAAAAMARRGRELALEHYRWSDLGEKLARCWRAAAEAPQPASASR